MVFTSLVTLMNCLSFTSNGLNNITPKHIVENRFIEVVYARTINDDIAVDIRGLLTYQDDNQTFNNQMFVGAGYEFDDDNSTYRVIESAFYIPNASNVFMMVDFYCYSGEGSSPYYYYSPIVYNSKYNIEQVYDGIVNPFDYDYDSFYYQFRIRLGLLPQSLYESDSENYAIGYSNGKTDGYNTGKTDGEEIGYENGFEDGEEIGYQNGYNAGITATTSDYGFMNLFGAIADTPLMMIRRMFNFDIFGTSMIVVVLSLLTLLILFKVVKKVIK